MSLRALSSFLCMFPVLATGAQAMPEAPGVAMTFSSFASLLPCQQNITETALNLGYTETDQTSIDGDYIDIEYSDAVNQSHLTIAVENTPIGALFSILIDIPETNLNYADTIVTALRRSWALPETVHAQNLTNGSQQNWTVNLPNGATQITVSHNAMTTQIIGTLTPLRPGTPLSC